MRVVVAEDQLLTREGIVRVLSDAGLEVVGEAVEVDVLGEDEHSASRFLDADASGGAQPFVGVRRREPYVDDGDVGPLTADEFHQRVDVGRFADDLEASVPEHSHDSLASEELVLGDYDAHGINASIVVSPVVSLPPSAAIRSTTCWPHSAPVPAMWTSTSASPVAMSTSRPA